MNRLSFCFAALGCAAVMGGVLGCTRTEQTPEPEVSVEISGTGMDWISFSVTAANASECSYMVVTGDESVPAAADILSGGSVIDLAAGSDFTADGLDPSTSYTVAVAVASEDGKTAVGTASATTAADPAIVLESATGRQYGSGNNFALTLTGTKDGIEYTVSLDLYDDESRELGYLSAGTWTVADSMDDGSLNSEYSTIDVYNTEDWSNISYKLASGTFEVKISGGEYEMRLDAIAVGKHETGLVFAYRGTVEDSNNDGVIWPIAE